MLQITFEIISLRGFAATQPNFVQPFASGIMEGKHHSQDYFDDVFDVAAYMKDGWGSEALKQSPLTKDIMDDVHNLFQKLNLPSDSKQLDFGCGPSIHMTLSSSRLCSEIVMTEYAAQNRRQVMEWLKGNDSGFSWDHMLEYVAQKEERSAEDIEKRTRKAIKEVLACDAEQDKIIGAAHLPPFDLITSCLCLEAACKDLPSYNKAVAALAGYLKPGGHLILSGVLDQTKYTVGDKLFYSLNHSRTDINNALRAAGFDNVEWCTHAIEVKFACEYDASGYFTLVAQKKLT